MNISKLEVMLAKTISLRCVHAYLSSNGWIRDNEASRKTADVYLCKDDDSEFSIVPSSDDYPDYALRIYQIAEQVGRIEGRSLRSVLTDLSLVDCDLVRVDVPSSFSDSTIDLTNCSDVILASKELLLATACSADRPQRMYRLDRNKQAMKFLSKVRMGHTEFGSLVINLISPVAPSLDKSAMLFSEDMFDEAFERRVTRKLASGLFSSRQAVDKVNRSNADIGEFESRIRDEISSNLCQSIASLVQAGRGLKIDISWAITRPVDPD